MHLPIVNNYYYKMCWKHTQVFVNSYLSDSKLYMINAKMFILLMDMHLYIVMKYVILAI